MNRWGWLAIGAVLGGLLGGLLTLRPHRVIAGVLPRAPTTRLAEDLPLPAFAEVERPNFLVIIADDFGQDQMAIYGVHPRPPPTPRLNRLAAQGMLFRNAVANPVCSPTRATLMTGRYAWRYGIGQAIPPRNGWGLPDTEVILPKVLKEASGGSYASALVGKWHLATPDMGGVDQARRLGFDHHWGTMGNLLGPVWGTDIPHSFTQWTRVVDGSAEHMTTYIITQTVDDTLHFMNTLPEPWFIVLALHAVHYPMHVPPAELFTQAVPARPSETDMYRLMVEAMDTEIGRLVDTMPVEQRTRTDLIFLGDNGTAPVGVVEPFDKSQSKGALLEGGITVPFFVVGPSVGVPGSQTTSLINTTDLFATLLDLAHVKAPIPEDSVSFAPTLADPSQGTRKYAFSERFAPNGMGPWEEHTVSVRDDRYKLILELGKPVAMFDLKTDPRESRNLFVGGKPPPEVLAAFKRLMYVFPQGVEVEDRPSDADVAALGVGPADRL